MLKFLLFISFLVRILFSAPCPCEYGALEPGKDLGPQLTLCVLLEPSLGTNVESIKRNINDSGTVAQVGVHYIGKWEQATKDHCSVLFVITKPVDRNETATYHRSLCPGRCEVIPVVSIPGTWLEKSMLTVDGADDLSLTCSMSLSGFMRRHATPYTRSFPLTTLIKEIFWRRIQECNEEKVWLKMYKEYRRIDPRPSSVNPNAKAKSKRGRDREGSISRRKVSSVVIWVGSTNEISQKMVHQQAQTLLGQPFEGTEAVIGWSADDFLYPCREGSHKCPGGHTGNKKYKFLPQSAVDAMGFGWACAQRRPLRALAHVLLLYDPSFVVLVDDDTFVNFPLLLHRFGPILRGPSTREEAVVLGELMGRQGDAGHVSKDGFVIGGSGYILGRNAVNRLQSREVAWLGGLGLPSDVPISVTKADGPLFDGQRSNEQMKILSILSEAVAILEDKESNNCSAHVHKLDSFGADNDQSCIGPLVPRRRRSSGSHTHLRAAGGAASQTLVKGGHSVGGIDYDGPLHQVVGIKDRLIDLCVRVLSSEHTCQHSDHVMGRCLLYGADAVYTNVACESLVPLETVPSTVPLGMCFMAKECDVQRHVTCHRYMPAGSPLLAESKEDGRSSNFGKDEVAVRKAMELIAKVNFRGALRAKRGGKRGSDSGSRSRSWNGDTKRGQVEVDYSQEKDNEGLLELMQYLASGGKGNPARKHDKGSNFKLFSSTWDGKITDTHT